MHVISSTSCAPGHSTFGQCARSSSRVLKAIGERAFNELSGKLVDAIYKNRMRWRPQPDRWGSSADYAAFTARVAPASPPTAKWSPPRSRHPGSGWHRE